MVKYIDLLNEGKEAKEQKQNALAAASAKSNVEKYISEKNEKSTMLSAARSAALSAAPFNVDKIVNLDVEIANNNKQLETAKTLLTELF